MIKVVIGYSTADYERKKRVAAESELSDYSIRYEKKVRENLKRKLKMYLAQSRQFLWINLTQ